MTDNKKVFELILKNFRSVNVTFLKLNGEKRTMKCTLHPDLIPSQYSGDEESRSDATISVWDIDSDGWRSFRVERVINVNFDV